MWIRYGIVRTKRTEQGGFFWFWFDFIRESGVELRREGWCVSEDGERGEKGRRKDMDGVLSVMYYVLVYTVTCIFIH